MTDDWTRLNFTKNSYHGTAVIAKMYCHRVVVAAKMSCHISVGS